MVNLNKPTRPVFFSFALIWSLNYPRAVVLALFMCDQIYDNMQLVHVHTKVVVFGLILNKIKIFAILELKGN